MIHNPTLVQMHLINPKDLKDGNSDDEEDKGKEKIASGRYTRHTSGRIGSSLLLISLLQ